ncbi:hypothetical protein LIER_37292 [Lithospermum erythrorhizon]|uniref:Integrase catalytic domain-containing protein n=1 Tax=Lithospermum erythrorhizon TaxID=34254 RepID=A0AAV3PIE1_LITER
MSSRKANQGVPPTVITGGHNPSFGTIAHGLDESNLQREKGLTITRIRSDHGNEFENSQFNDFCNLEGIKHEFSALITPQQNGIVERKNRTIQEMARVMLHAKKIPVRFWAEAGNTACYILLEVNEN